MVSVSVDGASPLLCTLFRWVGGRYVRSRLMPAHLEAVGRLTARLHDHSERLTVPAWFDRPTVDAADGETEDFMARILVDGVSPDAAEVLRAVYRRVRQAQEELGDGSDTFGLIHADIHQWNYLFDGGNVRLIDFGDCGWGHHLYDFAVILNCLEGHPRHPALRAALLRGYRQVRDLSPKHEALIDTFVMLREAQDLTWFVRDRHDPQYEKFTAQIGKMLVWLQERFAGKP